MRLKYWIRLGLFQACAALAASLLYTVYMSLLQGEGMAFILQMGATCLILFGAVVTAIYSFTHYKTEIPLAIACGSTRREVFVGLQLSRGVTLLLILTAALSLTALFKGSLLSAAMLFVGAFFTLTVFGVTGGIVIHRFQKNASVMIGLIIGLLCAAVPMMAALAMKNIMTTTIVLSLDVVGILGYLVLLPIEYKALQKLQVKL